MIIGYYLTLFYSLENCERVDSRKNLLSSENWSFQKEYTIYISYLRSSTIFFHVQRQPDREQFQKSQMYVFLKMFVSYQTLT